MSATEVRQRLAAVDNDIRQAKDVLSDAQDLEDAGLARKAKKLLREYSALRERLVTELNDAVAPAFAEQLAASRARTDADPFARVRR